MSGPEGLDSRFYGLQDVWKFEHWDLGGLDLQMSGNVFVRIEMSAFGLSGIADVWIWGLRFLGFGIHQCHLDFQMSGLWIAECRLSGLVIWIFRRLVSGFIISELLGLRVSERWLLRVWDVWRVGL